MTKFKKWLFIQVAFEFKLHFICISFSAFQPSFLLLISINTSSFSSFRFLALILHIWELTPKDLGKALLKALGFLEEESFTILVRILLLNSSSSMKYDSWFVLHLLWFYYAHFCLHLLSFLNWNDHCKCGGGFELNSWIWCLYLLLDHLVIIVFIISLFFSSFRTSSSSLPSWVCFLILRFNRGNCMNCRPLESLWNAHEFELWIVEFGLDLS